MHLFVPSFENLNIFLRPLNPSSASAQIVQYTHTVCMYSMTPGAAVTGRRVPRFTVFGLPVANCFHLMEENSGGQILVADKFKSQLSQVYIYHT
jgi:hypothetical protein